MKQIDFSVFLKNSDSTITRTNQFSRNGATAYFQRAFCGSNDAWKNIFPAAVYDRSIQSNTTFEYGLRRSKEVGLNLLNILYSTPTNRILVNPGRDPAFTSAYAPLILENFLKQWPITPHIKIGAGTQMGVNILYIKRYDIPDFITSVPSAPRKNSIE